MKTLVTGGAGFIPSFLVESLVEKGHDVIVLDDFSIGYKKNLNNVLGDIELIEDSVLNEAILKELNPKVDKIYHCAVLSLEESLENPEKVHEVNATGTLRMLKNFKDKLFYHISSSEIYGTAEASPMSEEHPTNPSTPYAVAKLCADRYALAFFKAYNSKIWIIRPFNSFGPRQRCEIYGGVIPKFIKSLMQNKQPQIFGSGQQKRDYTYVSDIVEGIIKASESEKLIGNAINLGSGEAYSVLDILGMVKKIMGKNVDPVFIGKREGDLDLLQADITKAKNVIGYHPKISFEQGLKKTVEWFKTEDS